MCDFYIFSMAYHSTTIKHLLMEMVGRNTLCTGKKQEIINQHGH